MNRPPHLGARRALQDTGAYFALVDRREQRYQEANQIFGRLAREPWQLFTTNFIVAETHALLLRRLGYRPALRFIDDIFRSTTTIVRVTPADVGRAQAIIRQYSDKLYPYVDCCSFPIMERLSIRYALTFDENFTQHRFIQLTA
ncbi:MAG: type II toxin-antitoxin system VapC family toxin [Dehalococcoidia bacterium]